MIAYIDDDEAARFLFGKVAQRDVKTFASVEEFEGDFEHVFTDLSLGKTYQWETIKALKEKHKGPITVISGLGFQDEMEKAYKAYGVGFIHKDILNKERIEQAIKGG